MTVYVCKESMEGILCGVYDAWMSKKGHENVRLQLDGCFEQELFAEYRDVQLDNRKVSSVIKMCIRDRRCRQNVFFWRFYFFV